MPYILKTTYKELGLTCKLCDAIDPEPQIISTCQEIFCKGCMDTLLKQKDPTCSSCRIKFTAAMVSTSRIHKELIAKAQAVQAERLPKPETPSQTISKWQPPYRLLKMLDKLNLIELKEIPQLLDILGKETVEGIKEEQFVDQIGATAVQRVKDKSTPYSDKTIDTLIHLLLDLASLEWINDQNLFRMSLISFFYALSPDIAIPQETWERAQKIFLNEPSYAELLPFTLNQADTSWVNVQNLLAKIDPSPLKQGLFYLNFLFRTRAPLSVRNMACKALFSEELLEITLKSLTPLRCALPKEIIATLVKNYTELAIGIRQTKLYRWFLGDLSMWFLTSSHNYTLNQIKRDSIDQIVQALPHMNEYGISSVTIILFSTLNQDYIDPQKTTTGYLWEKYLTLLETAPADLKKHIYVSEVAKKWSLHEADFFQFMLKAIADASHPIELKRKYAARLISYYKIQEFCSWVATEYPTPAILIEKEIKHPELRQIAEQARLQLQL